MRTLIRLRGAQRLGEVHKSMETAVRLCCHQLRPVIKAEFRRKGAFSEVAIELTAATLAACHRTLRE